MKTRLINNKNALSVSEILANRGINQNEIVRLGEDSLIDPFKMKNMKEAVDVVGKAISESNGIIAIQQDPDADGYSSTMALEHYLVSCHPEIKDRIHVLIQEDKTHGISLSELDRVTEGNTLELSVVIAPDCSSNEPLVHKYVTETYKSPVVVLDHHEASEYSQYATMVNPQLDDYPNKLLSGVGVVQKFLHAYDNVYGFSYSKNYFDLAAIRIIGDMIELKNNETIYMVQRGLKDIQHPFVKALYDKQSYSLKGEITPTGVSFYIAPLINATTRTATMEEKRMITRAMSAREPYRVQSTKRGETKDPSKTEIIQEQAVRVMTNIKSRQSRQVDKIVDELDRQVVEGNLLENQLLVLETPPDTLTSYNGLLANKFMQAYKKPTIVGTTFDLGDTRVFRGSARGDDKSELPNLMSFFNESGLVDYAQGHEAAHGVQMPLSNRELVVKHFNEKLDGIVFEPIHNLDFILDYKGNEKKIYSLLDDITKFSTFWGRGVEEPTFMIKGVPVRKKDVLVRGSFNSHTIKFTSGNLEFIAFRQLTSEAKKFTDNELVHVDVVGVASVNNFNDQLTLQVNMKEFEVQKAQTYYF